MGVSGDIQWNHSRILRIPGWAVEPRGTNATFRMGTAPELVRGATRLWAAASAHWSRTGAGSKRDRGAVGRLPDAATGWAAPGTAPDAHPCRMSTAAEVARQPRAGHRPAWSDTTG